MKIFKALATTACAIALATAAHAGAFTDSSSSDAYADGWSSGDNGGNGFGPWSITTTSGEAGWAGCGIWNPSANEFKGAWDGKTQAFGLMGKGVGFGVVASRSFRAVLDCATKDSFSLDMGVNWDANIDNAHKGFVLTAGGVDVLEINHGNYPGHIYVNGDDTVDAWNETPQEEGEILCPMTWKFTAKDATTLTVSANSRKDPSNIFEKDFTVSTSAIDGFRLQSVGQDNQDEDRRQSYYDNFVLDVAAPLSDLVSLSLSPKGENQWAVTRASQTLSFALERSSSAGSLTAAIHSTDPSFVHPTNVVFADGETTKTFTLDATLTGNANFSALSASGTGCEFPGSPFEIKGPEYSHEVEGDADPWILWNDESASFKVANNRTDGFPGDDSLVTVACDPDGIVTVTPPSSWEDNQAVWTVAGAKAGSTSAKVFYDGVQMGDDYGFTVLVPGFELSGPQTPKTGTPCTYTLKATLSRAESGCTVTVDPESDVAIDPVSFDLSEAEAGSYYYYQPISVTFNQSGKFSLTVKSHNYSASLPVEVSDPVDPSQFDSFIAYDETSLYGESNDLDYSARGAGSDKFQAWTNLYLNSDGTTNWAGATLVNAAGDSSVLTDGRAFAIYSNGSDDPEIQLLRPFVNSLSPGQAFSVVVAPNWRDGDKSVKLCGAYDGNWYDRVEFLYNNDGYFYKVDYSRGVSLNWDFSTKPILLTLQCAADGSSYTLSFARDGEETVTVEGITLPGMIDGVVFRSRNGGNGDENNLVFNKLAIEQVAPPARKIWLSGDNNPDAPGGYTFTLGASTTNIGVVALAVTEGAAVSPSSIDLTGQTEATFTVTLVTADPGSKFTITATPADPEVDPYTFDIYPIEPYCQIWLVGDSPRNYVSGGTVEFKIVGSPSRVGQTVYLDSGNENILLPPSPATAVVGPLGGEAESFFYTMAGLEDGQVWIHAYQDEDHQTEWAWQDVTINGKEGDDPYANILRITAMNRAESDMVLTVQGDPAAAYGATEIVGGEWAWKPIEAKINGSQVTVDMTGYPFLVIKVEK